MSKMSVKDDLSPLHRLEFYRKQKQWKFYKAKQNKTPQKCNKASMNITYNIESDDEAQESLDPHNTAFLDITPEHPKSKKLTIEWLVPINIPPAKDFMDRMRHSAAWRAQVAAFNRDLYSVSQNMQNAFKEAQEWKEKVLEEKVTDACVEAEEMGEAEGDLVDGNVPEELYNVAGNLAEDLGAGGSDTVSCECPQQLSDLGDAVEQVPDGDGDGDGDNSVDSEGQFMRGAHAAPHSSSQDLALPHYMCHEMTYKDLSRLSTRQLDAASQHHLQALHNIQQELGLRQRLGRDESLYAECYANDAPTSDVERDVIVAGSHLQRMRLLREERAEHKRKMIHENLKCFL